MLLVFGVEVWACSPCSYERQRSSVGGRIGYDQAYGGEHLSNRRVVSDVTLLTQHLNAGSMGSVVYFPGEGSSRRCRSRSTLILTREEVQVGKGVVPCRGA